MTESFWTRIDLLDLACWHALVVVAIQLFLIIGNIDYKRRLWYYIVSS